MTAHAAASPVTLPKYGRPLTGSDWVGLPLREGHWPGSGALEDLTADSDTVLTWTGGHSEVTLLSKAPRDTETTRHVFTRISGMIDLMPKGTVLESVRWEGEPTTCVAVNFPATCIRDLTDARDLGLDPERGPQFCLVDAHVVDLARRLQANANGSEELGAVYVQSLSLALISYVSAKYGRSKTPPEEDGCGFPAQQRQELAAFIDDHLSTNFGLVDLAALVAYSPDHFSRLFKRSFGLPPHKYVSTRRVERAKAMLIDGSAQIAAIASACGFSSQAHLCDVFKRHTGITPGAYRRG